MRIDFRVPDNKSDTGFGHAGDNIVQSLQNLGHELDNSAEISINFCHPSAYRWTSGQYRIGYTPWESTALRPGWAELMNDCDEMWTTSPLIAEWFNTAGVTKDIHVFQHGVSSIWTPRLRRPAGKLRFLHIGEPAPRKGAQLAMEAFRAAFGDDNNVHLTIKANRHHSLRVYGGLGNRSIIGLPDQLYKNISIVTESLPIEGLVSLYRSHHVLVYPSFGEGFGLIPLQAIASGMPTICTSAWAPYQDFIIPQLRLQSRLAPSPWPEMHPGEMFHPDRDHLVELYRYAAHKFDVLAGRAMKTATMAVHEYQWDNLTKNTFTQLEQRIA